MKCLIDNKHWNLNCTMKNDSSEYVEYERPAVWFMCDITYASRTTCNRQKQNKNVSTTWKGT